MRVQDIDFTVSLHKAADKKGTVLGRWNVNKAKGVKHIVLFLRNIWQYRLGDKEVGEYGIFDVDRFTDELILTIVVEVICIERANQGLKIKNRCKPCKVLPVALAMHYDRPVRYYRPEMPLVSFMGASS